MKEDTILKVLPWDVRSIIQKEKLEFEYLQEIRLREGKPLIFLYHDTGRSVVFLPEDESPASIQIPAFPFV